MDCSCGCPIWSWLWVHCLLSFCLKSVQFPRTCPENETLIMNILDFVSLRRFELSISYHLAIFPEILFATRITGNPEMESLSAVKLQHHFGIFFVIFPWIHRSDSDILIKWKLSQLSLSVLEGRCSLPRVRSLTSPLHLLQKLNGTQISVPYLMPPSGRQISQLRF